MNPQLLRAIAVERMDEIAREAEEHRRARGLPRRRSAPTRESRPSLGWPSVRASIRRPQPGA